MANAKRIGTLIKNARLDAGLTQEQLARKVRNCSANDISRAERGEKELTTDQLKQIAKATGVTQKSLLDAAKGTSSSARSGALTVSMKVTATEKRLVKLYRAADSDSKKNALKLLRGEGASALAEDLFESVWDSITGKK
ncbi:MAG: helix-turn-helix transcriptional regulator [Clostridia bacterium]|nr:helix-turn-helix transcriptional regulator [Clostridia bacterium]